MPWKLLTGGICFRTCLLRRRRPLTGTATACANTPSRRRNGQRRNVRHRRGYLLLEWIRQTEQDAPKPMQGFAGFLRQDLDVVTASLTLPWSSGVVEDHVNRVKTHKRAMYGRASFELLRTRIFTQP
jgi:transposase